MTAVKRHHLDGIERTFPYDTFQLFLQLSILIVEVPGNGMLE